MQTLYKAPPSQTAAQPNRTVLVAVALAGLSLVFSALSFVVGASDGDVRSVEDRLACLELPAWNHCGPGVQP